MRILRHQLIWASLISCLLVAGWQAWTIFRIHRDNALMQAWLGQADQRDSDTRELDDIALRQNAPPQLHLARAIYFKHRQRDAEALEVLSTMVGRGDRRLQSQSRYNLGNLYLKQAQDEVEAGRINQAMPLLTLAKQAYRQALTLDSGFWDAKYNLELAMKLLPEFDRVNQNQPDDDAARPSQRWTTVPGFPRGLP